MVLGKLPMPGHPTIWITVGQGPTALAVGPGGGCLDIFTLIYPFFPLSPSLWKTARYRLKYCLKGPLNPKVLDSSFTLLAIMPNKAMDRLQNTPTDILSNNILVTSYTRLTFLNKTIYLYKNAMDKQPNMSMDTVANYSRHQLY